MGSSVRALVSLRALSPALYERAIIRGVEEGFFRDEPGESCPGSLFEPEPERTSIVGGFNEEAKRTAARVGRRNAGHAAVTVPLLVGVALLGRRLLSRREDGQGSALVARPGPYHYFGPGVR